jgi:hypothetical protein
MDQSVVSIVTAFISAAASVIVALIGKSSPARARRRGEPQRVYIIPSTNKRVWITSILILSLWLLLSPTLIHWDLAGSNFFLIFIVTLVLSYIWPIRPWGAAAVVLMLYSVNFFMEPLGWWVHGISISFNPNDLGYFLLVLGLGFVNTVGSWSLARWRGRKFAEIAEAETKAETTGTESHPITTLLADEIAKLSKLRESGALSDEEFQKAKNKLLHD